MEPKSHTIRNIIIISTLVLVIVAAWYASQPELPVVTIATADTGTVESIVANTRAGTVKACRRARLAPATGGQIKDLPVHIGSLVKKGDILFEIWNEDLRARLVLANQESRAVKAGAKEQCVTAEVSEHEAERLTKLLRQKLSSEEAADRAVGEARARRAGCMAALENVKVSDAKRDVIQVDLDRTIMRAPFDGIVAEVNGEVGEFVTPSPIGIATLPVVDLIDNTCLYVTAPIDEVDAPAIRAGMETRITLDAFKQHHFPGKVRRVAPYVQDIAKQARTVDIEVDFSNVVGTHNLLPGYSADTEVILAIRENVVRIPSEAIFDVDHVLVYRPDSQTLENKQIKSGASNWVVTEILSGLAPGDKVVTSAKREGLADGTAVIAEMASDSIAGKRKE